VESLGYGQQRPHEEQRASVLVITPFAIAVVFGMIYTLRKQGASAGEIKLIRQAVEKNFAEAKAMHHNLHRQRGIINDIHKQIVAVTKSFQKPAA
jgi:hypothetical protein